MASAEVFLVGQLTRGDKQAGRGGRPPRAATRWEVHTVQDVEWQLANQRWILLTHNCTQRSSSLNYLSMMIHDGKITQQQQQNNNCCMWKRETSTI